MVDLGGDFGDLGDLGLIPFVIFLISVIYGLSLVVIFAMSMI